MVFFVVVVGNVVVVPQIGVHQLSWKIEEAEWSKMFGEGCSMPKYM